MPPIGACLKHQIRVREEPVLSPRRCPCASCPYRRDVPSGIWAACEYDKLTDYDGSTIDQVKAGAFSIFLCHQQDGHLCAGWVGCHDMAENLAIRMNPRVDYDAVLSYQSPVPLFDSGAEAAAHGKRDINDPDIRAQQKIIQLARQQARRPGAR